MSASDGAFARGRAEGQRRFGTGDGAAVTPGSAAGESLADSPELVSKLRAWLPTADPSEKTQIEALLATLPAPTPSGPADPAAPPTPPTPPVPAAVGTAMRRGREEARKRFGDPTAKTSNNANGAKP